jgi:VanZ family protein
MLKHIKNLLKASSFIIAIVVTFSIAYLSLMRVPNYSFSVSHLDKLQHLFAYFILTICWLFSFRKVSSRKYMIVTACIIYGIIIEVLQSLITDYRTGDYFDVMANTFGVLLALTIFNQISKKNQFN